MVLWVVVEGGVDGGRRGRTSPFRAPLRGSEKNQLGSYHRRLEPRKTNQRLRQELEVDPFLNSHPERSI